MAISAFVDEEYPALLERLGNDHARIDQINQQLARLGDRLEAAEDSPELWDEVADCLEFLKHYADKIHHPLEDRLFDAVLHKGLTPTERHLVFRNLGQHQEIMTLTDSLTGQLHLARTGSVVDPAMFVELLDEYLALQRRHMTFEEMHMFPLLMSRLDNTDWNNLSASLPEHFRATGLSRDKNNRPEREISNE